MRKLFYILGLVGLLLALYVTPVYASNLEECRVVVLAGRITNVSYNGQYYWIAGRARRYFFATSTVRKFVYNQSVIVIGSQCGTEVLLCNPQVQ